jgi:hypothetical protein
MSLVKSIEVLPAKNEKLKDYLYTELKNQTKWKENRSDAIEDQYKYYESYIGKEYHVQKDLIPNLLKESEKVHLDYLNYHLLNRMRFLEIKPSASEGSFMLYLFDNDDKQLNLVNFNIACEGGNTKLELIDQGSIFLKLDSKAREVKTYRDTLLLADMYSLYSCNMDSELCELAGFTKQLTFDETPTQCLSDVMMDKLLLLNGHSLNFIDCNQYTLIQTKCLKQSTLKPFRQCDFFNIPVNAILYNKTQCVLSDIRVK